MRVPDILQAVTNKGWTQVLHRSVPTLISLIASVPDQLFSSLANTDTRNVQSSCSAMPYALTSVGGR